MNIFVSHPDPHTSAMWLDDARLNKMITESAQMASTNIRLLTDNDPELCDGLYRPSHQNHPCNVWMRASRDNFVWLLRHAFALAVLKENGTGKRHKSTDVLDRASKLAWVFPEGEQTPFANCAANEERKVSFKHIKDPHEAYRMYLVARWLTDKLPPAWTHSNRTCPDWAVAQLHDKYGPM